MPLLSFFFPILAHGEGDIMSLGELVISVSLLLLSASIAAAMLIFVFIKPIQRVRRQRREGRPSHSSTKIYVVLIVAVICTFLAFTWQTSWDAYYDVQQKKYEEKLAASGKHKKKGTEYKWNRWLISSRFGADKLILFVDDIFEEADPQKKITATARIIAPSTSDWRAMTWDPTWKAFVLKVDPEGEKMEFEFRFKSGFSSYTDDVIAYVPKTPAKTK
jgi:hypothetical protein